VILVIALILVLISTLLSELKEFYEESEQVQMQAVLDSLNSSVNSLVTEQIVAGDLNSLAGYQDTNPMQLLTSSGFNYSGEFSGSGVRPEPARWYFNTTSRHLVYQLRDSSKVAQQGGNAGQLNFRLRLKYQDNNHNQRYDRDIDRVVGLVLKPVYPYQWLKS